MRNILYAIGILLLATACQNNKGYEFPKAPEQVFLTEKNMPPIEYFTLEKVEVPEAAEVDQKFFVYADTILFTIQNKRPNPYILSVYNLNTKELIAGYFKKGTGPYEYLSLNCKFSDNEVIAFDYAQNAVSVMNIDSILDKRYEYKPQIVYVKDNVCYNHIRIVNDSIVGQYRNHFYGYGCEKNPEFIKISCHDGVASCKVELEIDPFSINQRYTLYNKHTRQYITGWLNFPYINIYDENFVLQKQYIGPEKDMLEVELDEGVLMEKENTSTSFYGICFQTSNHILFINSREIITDVRKNGRRGTKPQEIFCFDKELNLVGRFKTKIEKSNYGWLSYSEETGNLYVNAQDENGENALYKCIFEK